MNEKQNNEEIMNYISKMYRDIKEDLKTNQKKNPYIIDQREEFVAYIDSLVDLLPEEYAKIIRNDYLSERNKKWWMEYFKKSTYYRRKCKAVEAFVDCVTL